MKKFLTVLLVIAVMFTFSFGSAFAATPVPGDAVTTHDEAIAKAAEELVAAMNELAAAAKADLAANYKDIYDGTYIDVIVPGSVYAATIDKIAADYAGAVAVAAQKVSAAYPAETTVATLKGYIGNEDFEFTYAGVEYDVTLAAFASEVGADMDTYATTASGMTNLQGYYSVFTRVNALAGVKATMEAELAKIDMSLYTEDVIKPADAYKTTYAQKAAKAKADLLEEIADLEVTMADSVTSSSTSLLAVLSAVDTALIGVESYTDIYGTKTYTSYKLVGIETAEDLAADKADDAASVAALKAEIAKRAAAAYATALSTYNASAKEAADKEAFEIRQEKIDAYVEVLTVLVEEGKINTIAEEPLGVGLKYTNLVATYEAAEELAATLKLEVEKEGSPKYDAAEIDEILAELKVSIYNGGAAAVESDFDDAKVAENTFEWDKAHAICDVEDAMELALYNADGSAKYYAPEQAKVEAKFAAKIAKIEAAATDAQLNYEAGQTVDISGIKTKSQVRSAVAAHSNTQKFAAAVEQYVKYLNYTANAAAYSDAYRNETVAYDANSAVVKYLAGEGARTNADVAAYLAQAEAYAQTIKTNGEIKAAKAAANEAIKALPTVITLADKEAVKAAYELADDAGVESTKLAKAVAAVQAAEKKAIDDAVKALPAKLTAADHAAVEAIFDAIEVYEEEEMYTSNDYDETKVEAAAAAVKAAWLKDVHAAIAAADAADAASVEAARAAVDAYVAEYTSVCADVKAIKDIKNIDKLTFAEAQVALAQAAEEAAMIKEVEALKITASSVAKKGSITVKWTVEGDTDAVEGYEIWKSTKKNSGFKKAFTTTKMSYKNTKGLEKGTRYFYKVRAIAYTAEGEKVKSDWSNKAYRVAK